MSHCCWRKQKYNTEWIMMHDGHSCCDKLFLISKQHIVIHLNLDIFDLKCNKIYSKYGCSCENGEEIGKFAETGPAHYQGSLQVISSLSSGRNLILWITYLKYCYLYHNPIEIISDRCSMNKSHDLLTSCRCKHENLILLRFYYSQRVAND